LDFSPQIEFSFPTRLSSFKYILSKFQSLYFWTSLINFSDHFLSTPTSYCYFQFLPTIYLYLFLLLYFYFYFLYGDPKMGYNTNYRSPAIIQPLSSYTCHTMWKRARLRFQLDGDWSYLATRKSPMHLLSGTGTARSLGSEEYWPEAFQLKIINTSDREHTKTPSWSF